MKLNEDKQLERCNGTTLIKGAGMKLCPIRRGCKRYNNLMPIPKDVPTVKMQFDYENYSCENFVSNDYGNYKEA